MSIRMLIVEDDEYKATDLREGIIVDCDLLVVASVRDAVVEIFKGTFDVVVLDMALPTFTADAASSSGTAQPQGGVEVLRAMKSMGERTPIIIVSQYPDLEIDGQFHSLEASPEVLSKRYGINVVSAIVYDFRNRAWADDFAQILGDLVGRDSK